MFRSSKILRVAEQTRRYGTQRFSWDKLSQRAQAALAETREKGAPLSKSVADEVAATMHEWAVGLGAVSYAHLFQPLRDGPAEKHDSFLRFSGGSVQDGFTGSMLFSGESDGSSFPNGGLRATHSAGAYTAWDTSVTPWVRDGTLYLPSIFVTFDGVPLDEKTPLLRSMDAVSDSGVKLLHSLGDNGAYDVVPEVGWEQEFFVLDAELAAQRPDIMASGRTVLGAAPPRGQQTDTNYFGVVPPRVKAFLRDAQAELWNLGISCITLHNEVAPAQHETAPIFSVTNAAADDNILAMSVIREAAMSHGLCVLYHEKPFAGHNGSGKHNNWSLTAKSSDAGVYNVTAPGSTPHEQAAFVAFTAANIHAMAHHGDLVRASVATAGNDHRLGAQEAPPSVMSTYLGHNLTSHLEAVLAGGPLAGYSEDVASSLSVGAHAIPPLTSGLEDRNRTSPFPFIGNRFELRAVGSNQNISTPLTYLHAAVADGLDTINGKIEGGDSPRDAVAAVLKDSFHAVFNGDGYSAEWEAEAAKRGLPNARTTDQAVLALADQKNIDLLGSKGILEPAAVAARLDVALSGYAATIELEAEVQHRMMVQGYIPAAATDARPAHAATYEALEAASADLAAAIQATRKAIATASAEDAAASATELRAVMDATRVAADAAELTIPAKAFPFPNYAELMYNHHM